MPSDRPIFVFGCPRSGTTLLTLMLHSHSRIAMPPETRLLLPVYRSRARFGDLADAENRRALAAHIVNPRTTWCRRLRLDAPAVRKQIEEGPPTVGSALGTVFRGYAARFGKERWGDKRPSYYRNVDTIRALFPDAQFIHMVRDGRDCVASMKKMPWWRHGTILAIAVWAHSIDCGRRAARRLPADSFHVVRYERLVTDPRAELVALCEFLGEDFEEQMLEPYRVAVQTLPRPQRRQWHANTVRAVTANSIGTYSEGLDPRERRLMEFVARRRLRRLGYDAPRVPPVPHPSDLLTYLVKLTLLRLQTRLLSLRDRQIAGQPGPVADLGAGVGKPVQPPLRSAAPVSVHKRQEAPSAGG